MKKDLTALPVRQNSQQVWSPSGLQGRAIVLVVVLCTVRLSGGGEIEPSRALRLADFGDDICVVISKRLSVILANICERSESRLRFDMSFAELSSLCLNSEVDATRSHVRSSSLQVPSLSEGAQ